MTEDSPTDRVDDGMDNQPDGNQSDGDQPDQITRDDDEIDDVPRVTCSTCDRTWELTYELDELQVGNRALEQFALDHARHTGHYPDDVTPFVADCRHCPEREQFLSKRPAERFAEAHTRHTRHEVRVTGPDETDETFEPGGSQ